MSHPNPSLPVWVLTRTDSRLEVWAPDAVLSEFGVVSIGVGFEPGQVGVAETRILAAVAEYGDYPVQEV